MANSAEKPEVFEWRGESYRSDFLEELLSLRGRGIDLDGLLGYYRLSKSHRVIASTAEELLGADLRGKEIRIYFNGGWGTSEWIHSRTVATVERSERGYRFVAIPEIQAFIDGEHLEEDDYNALVEKAEKAGHDVSTYFYDVNLDYVTAIEILEAK